MTHPQVVLLFLLQVHAARALLPQCQHTSPRGEAVTLVETSEAVSRWLGKLNLNWDSGVSGDLARPRPTVRYRYEFESKNSKSWAWKVTSSVPRKDKVVKVGELAVALL